MRIQFSVSIVFCHLFFIACHSQQKQPIKNAGSDSIYAFKSGSVDGIGKFYYGREIAQVMGAAGSEWLERDTRNQEENTELVIDKINVPANGTIADIGAGTGYYSFRLTKKVPQGKVYAVEIQDEMIQYLQNKKQSLKDTVVTIVKGTIQSPNLPDNSVDLAIMVDVYHELQFPHEMLQAIRRTLKPNGKILLIEYRGEDPSVPIKALHKTTVSQLNKELEANGFKLNYRGEFLPIQHFLLYEKR
jgi:SAM-dependent methyltransferase